MEGCERSLKGLTNFNRIHYYFLKYEDKSLTGHIVAVTPHVQSLPLSPLTCWSLIIKCINAGSHLEVERCWYIVTLKWLYGHNLPDIWTKLYIYMLILISKKVSLFPFFFLSFLFFSCSDSIYNNKKRPWASTREMNHRHGKEKGKICGCEIDMNHGGGFGKTEDV